MKYYIIYDDNGFRKYLQGKGFETKCKGVQGTSIELHRELPNGNREIIAASINEGEDILLYVTDSQDNLVFTSPFAFGERSRIATNTGLYAKYYEAIIKLYEKFILNDTPIPSYSKIDIGKDSILAKEIESLFNGLDSAKIIPLVKLGICAPQANSAPIESDDPRLSCSASLLRSGK